MAQISPFKGWRYNDDLIDDFTKVIVPPYDVITAGEQDQYYSMSPNNYIRINLNRSEGEERYINASKALVDLQQKGVLKREAEKAIYILSQSFDHDGKMVNRVGCICALKLSELDADVLPHEQTIKKHLDDRYKLMDATQANSGQIFMCYQDEQMVLEKIYNSLNTAPEIDSILDNIRTQLWVVTDTQIIENFKNCLQGKKVVIADGHHRYKTALRYNNDHHKLRGTDKVMVILVNSSNPGMSVLPTHRLLSGIDIAHDEIIEKLKTHFSMDIFEGPKLLLESFEMDGLKKGQMGVYHRESNTALLLNFLIWDKLNEMFSDQCRASRELDTNIMHRFIMKDVFGVDTSNQQDLKKLSYMRGNKPALDLLNAETDYDVACFIQPPSLDEIFTIAKAGETMPQKSTYFFPKVYSGLVTRCFSE